MSLYTTTTANQQHHSTSNQSMPNVSEPVFSQDVIASSPNQLEINSTLPSLLPPQPTLLAASSSSSVANPDTRTHVVGELYDTERSYVESLQILVEKYMKPLKSLESNRVLIDSNLVDEIFYTIPEILHHHETFLSALQDRLSSDWDTTQIIGNVFIEAFTNQQIIDTYTAFINNWKNARQAIKLATQAKPAFERYLEAMSREHRNKLTLDALLIMPVQRIPRYELLIKELIKHTPDEHPDYGPLIEAQKEIHELALKIDRAEKEMIHQEQLKDIESLIDGHVELQHPQRDFIRYDLVTILGASALTMAKKERVLFLFCDLLIMTSIKKKASRRSNLQAAFANSFNDLSLLEGNKFKLLLRVSLDQVEIRLENDQFQLQLQQKQEHQHQLQLQQQSRLIQDRKREIEADIHILNEMEALSSNLNPAYRTKINETITDMMAQLKHRLFSLEQSDLQSTHQISTNLSQGAQQDLYTLQQQGQVFNTTLLHPTIQTNNYSTNNQSLHTVNNQLNSPSSISLSIPSSTSTSNQQDSNTSLEFIISNNNPAIELISNKVNSSSAIGQPVPNDQSFTVGSPTLGASSDCSSQVQQTSSYETLVVTFASVDRRQAFLQAFIDAKQLRYQIQQQRHQQRMFSSSLTLNKDTRRKELQYQDNLDSRIPLNTSPCATNKLVTKAGLQQQNLNSTTPQTSSAPASNHSGATIIHQMSAPQSLDLITVSASPNDNKDRSSSQCTSCSPALELEKRHNHHHHQLIHQPASHPASLQTICCHEKHNDKTITPKLVQSPIQRSNQLNELTDVVPINDENYKQQQNFYHDYYEHMKRQLDSNSKITINSDIFIPSTNDNTLQLIGHLNQALLFTPAPKFLNTLPMNFLNTQHPALQFTCSTLRNKDFGSTEQRPQTVKDNSGQLWLCMSNGYVSHIALISMRKRKIRRGYEGLHNPEDCDDSQAYDHCYNIVPVIQSAGDICKSHINCATQVRWTRKVSTQTSDLMSSNSSEGGAGCDSTKSNGNDEATKRSIIEVAIKSASPPVDINLKSKVVNENNDSQKRLSESAPSQSDIINKVQDLTQLSASITRLEVPFHPTRSVSQPQNIQNGQQTRNNCLNRKRASNDAICQRHHNNYKYLQNRPNSSISPRPQQISHSHNHLYHHHHHHLHNQNVGQSTKDDSRLSHHHHHHFHHHHQHSHQHHLHQNAHQPHHYSYHSRHHTISLAELRRALQKQDRVGDQHHPNDGRAAHQQAQHADPTITDTIGMTSTNIEQQSSIDRCNTATTPILEAKKLLRSSTPPAGYSGNKSFRSARLLRHQASLKTSSILAKLVSGASKHSAYLRKSNQNQEKHQSDLDDNDTDTDSGILQPQLLQRQEDTSSIDSNILALTTPGANKCLLTASNLDMNHAVVSPLSSVSSLNSTTSSMTVNSVCASSPNRSMCESLAHSASSTCCIGSMAQPILGADLCPDLDRNLNSECGLRSRSATVPCRALCNQQNDSNMNSCPQSNCGEQNDRCIEDLNKTSNMYKVSEIIGESDYREKKVESSENKVKHKRESSLWLGCDDGSLIIIDCINKRSDEINCDACDPNHQNFNCGNVHSEIKLGASVCDICTYKDMMVFVALSNGQLAIFYHEDDSNKDNDTDIWSLTNPKLLSITANELNSTSKLCLVNDNFLWYSYGRSIFVLNVKTLKLETTIMAPTNDLSLQFPLQSITIDSMLLMTNFAGVWVSFKNSHLIQLYNVVNYKLLAEINLFEPVNKMLSYGNEIIRQHKTACLKATSLLNVTREHCSTLFIGTSAGVILYLNISHEQLVTKEPSDGSILEWNPQVASLRHGHSGHVKFLHLIEVEEDQNTESPLDKNNNDSIKTSNTNEKNMILISGGTGVDLYGHSTDQQIYPQLNNEDDNLNHLVLWQL